MSPIDALARFVDAHPRLLVLTGAGCSTECGIPGYRDDEGRWKRSPPILYREFLGSGPARRRYWARSLIGWRRVAGARPGPAHHGLARLEGAGVVHHLVTQNVDGLHQRAGHREVTDLHGILHRVACITCGAERSREALQHTLEALNPSFRRCSAPERPDGDAELPVGAEAGFRVPACNACGGVIKPTVVFFGENVPRTRVAEAMTRLEESQALLVVGSSLTVWSGYRFVVHANRLRRPVALLNLGRTRADGEVALALRAPCGEVLEGLAERLGVPDRPGCAEASPTPGAQALPPAGDQPPARAAGIRREPASAATTTSRRDWARK